MGFLRREMLLANLNQHWIANNKPTADLCWELLNGSSSLKKTCKVKEVSQMYIGVVQPVETQHNADSQRASSQDPISRKHPKTFCHTYPAVTAPSTGE